MLVILTTVSFNHTPYTYAIPISLHDALPISSVQGPHGVRRQGAEAHGRDVEQGHAVGLRTVRPTHIDARRTVRTVRSRSEEHTSELQYVSISYAVFCLKKKKIIIRSRWIHRA